MSLHKQGVSRNADIQKLKPRGDLNKIPNSCRIYCVFIYLKTCDRIELLEKANIL